MSLRINTNVDAFRAYRNLDHTQSSVSKSMEKLSSGLRINRASDDAAGLAISERLNAQIRGVDQASRNVADGVSLVQTAEGALDQVHAILQRVRELAVQYANGTNSAKDKAAMTAEAVALCAEVERIGSVTEFNGTKLFDAPHSFSLQVGTKDSQTISVSTATLFSSGTASVDGDILAGVFNLAAGSIIASIDEAIEKVSTSRSSYGAVQNRLEYTAASLSIYKENLSDSLSRIRDVDMAAEMVKFTKNQILQQAGTAMLAQANQAPQSVLQLLK